jgi:protein dithiol:quinone oxidoreductase
MRLLTIRKLNLLAFIICCALIAFALILEVYAKQQPCPLCITQRVIIIVLGILFLFGSLINFQKTGRVIYHLIIFLIAVLGAVIAARHVWLTTLPPDAVPPCGPGITYLFQMLPLNEALKTMFIGGAECGKVTWRLLGLNIPEWTLIWFIFFALFALWQSFRNCICISVTSI